MGKLVVEGMEFHAFHGCNPEEAKTGGNYLVTVTVDTDFSKPSSSDKLSDAVDYVAIYDITKREMSLRSHLINMLQNEFMIPSEKSFLK